MKRYDSLGQLLIDYRQFTGVSQLELSGRLHVDIKTIGRWEKNLTLVKPEKEAELVEVTFLPYQVIRNLNANVPIATYFDLRTRRYSLTSVSTPYPDASTYKKHIEVVSPRVRPIKDSDDINHILKYYDDLEPGTKGFRQNLLEYAVPMIPQLNLIIEDLSGFYAGHSMYLCISEEAYLNIRSKKMPETAITEKDLVDYRTQTRPIFHSISVYADCNENHYYLMSNVMRFVKESRFSDYLMTGVTKHAAYKDVLPEMGFNAVWSEPEKVEPLGLNGAPTFVEGKLDKFLEIS